MSFAMTPTSHTYGTNCRLAPISPIPNENGMPPVVSQFFYSTLIPIDELLSTPGRSGSSDHKSPKRQLRPFGRGDNNALEKAWTSLASDDLRDDHNTARAIQRETASASNRREHRRQRLVETLALKHFELHNGFSNVQHGSRDIGRPAAAGELPVCCQKLRSEASEALQQTFCALLQGTRPELAISAVMQDIVDSMRAFGNGNVNKYNTPIDRPETQNDTLLPSITAVKGLAEEQRKPRSNSEITTGSNQTGSPTDVHVPARLPATNVGISGKPFIRVGNEYTSNSPHAATTSQVDVNMVDPPSDCDSARVPQGVPDIKPTSASVPNGSEESVLDVVVGVSRLHKVSLPTLLMKPIYWSPINDVAVVMRATWFYRDTMMPVAPIVANQLEAGYQELQPWTQTWRDELRCAVDIGPSGEEKVSHCLWPQDSKHFDGKGPEPDPKISSEPFCSARCFRGDAAAQGSTDTVVEPSKDQTLRAFSNYHVIYKDDRHAFLLKPSLRPSAYYGRKPVSKITKSFTIGIPVVRGFERHNWDRFHEHRNNSSDKRGAEPEIRQDESANENDEPPDCHACDQDKGNGLVTDLVLVAHGIGQKIAERVESYHFTHAINGFRRAVNQEMRNPNIQHVLRQGHNGVMILPLNWRMGLSFEDGGLIDQHSSNEEQGSDSFGLKDIEPNTIPAVRSMISDVMFDIPFYMSHHKSKMINALVLEANRVYRLWCQNNPGFASKGKVHLIAHSLGSVMAVDILSRQPTDAPNLNLNRVEPEMQFFEFDTTNLFLVGSPAGFFLLLERGALIPRRGRRKPGADARDVMDTSIVSDAGRFGCLAVDNIYNVLAKEDPIAYLLNGAVDSAYASVLKTAYVPSGSTSIFKSMSDAMRQIVPGLASPRDPLATGPERPSTVRLPSQLELEVHDFTREEIAEKKFFLLNDNGQIDWFLRSGSGPLEIQYLNMLSAHTSYWINQDFIRMLCLEIGRQPGRSHSIPSMRAIKATKRFSLEK